MPEMNMGLAFQAIISRGSIHCNWKYAFLRVIITVGIPMMPPVTTTHFNQRGCFAMFIS